MIAYIGLGANLGDREGTLREAVRRLDALGTVAAVSSLYETEPVGYLDQPPFLNAVAAVETDLEPGDVVPALLDIERQLGRTRSFTNAPRTLDLDLLIMGEVHIESADVTIPHPRLHQRAFVLIPLTEIAPSLRHPIQGITAAELLVALPTTAGVRRLALPGWVDAVEMPVSGDQIPD